MGRNVIPDRRLADDRRMEEGDGISSDGLSGNWPPMKTLLLEPHMRVRFPSLTLPARIGLRRDRQEIETASGSLFASRCRT